MADYEKKENWKSNLWKRDSEIRWEKYSDQQLIELAENGCGYKPFEAEGYVKEKSGKRTVIKTVKGTEGFQAYHKTPFDYGQVCYELGRRGYKQETHWVKKENANPIVREKQGNNKGIEQYLVEVIQKSEKPTYEKIPLYFETKQLLAENFGHLPKGIRGPVIAQMLDILIKREVGE